MHDLTLKKIDPFGDDVDNFRNEIITVDEQYESIYVHNDIKYNADIPEEVWKFSHRKWSNLNLDTLYGVYYGSQLASISGAKLYGKENNFLRLGMHYYTLKRYRQVVRSTLWNLMIPSALKDFQNIDYSFVTIYPHNSQLEAWCQKLIAKNTYGQLSNDNSHLELLRSYNMEDKFIKFNNVLQRVLYRRERNSLIKLESLYNEIEDH